MRLNDRVLQYLSEKCGCDVTTPAGATALALAIETKTGERLAANTIKRLTGVLPYDGNPRPATLDIIAKYAGYSSWKNFCIDLYGFHSSGFQPDPRFVDVTELPPGKRISFGWAPDRKIRLKHLGNGVCEVIQVENSKLAVGDILHISQLADNFPLIVKNVIRNGISLGSYTAAQERGIYRIMFR